MDGFLDGSYVAAAASATGAAVVDAASAAAASAVNDESPAETRYIGLALAIASSVAIGTSFIITKKGLISAADSGVASSSSYAYLRNGLWWMGMVTMVVGEICNFAAYLFAPPVLVTPLGALSVLVGAVLAAFFLGERLGRIGVSGCSLCLVGSLIIVLHAPEDKPIDTVDEILGYALQPGFMAYCLFVTVFSVYMIYKVAPIHGSSNPLIYISICSLVGSISVMAVKGLGVAIKVTLSGNNQLWRPGTWVFAFTVAFAIAVQMNFFNKALDLFPTTVVNPSYFVGFSTSTLIASIILFHGLNTSGGSNTFSLLCGLFVICTGVYLLNLSRSESESHDPDARHALLDSGVHGQRISMSNRISMASDGHDGARRSTTLYRGGGAVMGGVEPLFDYGADHHPIQMQHCDDDDDDDDDDDMHERRGLKGRRMSGHGRRSDHPQQQQQHHYHDAPPPLPSPPLDELDLVGDAEANQRWRSGEPSRGSLLDGGKSRLAQ